MDVQTTAVWEIERKEKDFPHLTGRSCILEISWGIVVVDVK